MREGVFFVLINVGISWVLKLGQITFPDTVFRALPVFLVVVGLILSLNLYRAHAAPQMRVPYSVISVLNVLTTVGIGNSGFLTSIPSIYRILGSLI